MKINLDGEGYPVPQAWIYGYQDTQVLSYECYCCKSHFFDVGSDPWNKLLCDLCSNKRGCIVVPASNPRHLNLIGFKQVVDTIARKRTRRNFKKVLKRDEYICQYCQYDPRKSIDGILPLHVDHIIPFSYGGKNSLTNLVTACGWCNAHISNKIFDNFMDKKTYINELRKKTGKPVGARQWTEYLGKII